MSNDYFKKGMAYREAAEQKGLAYLSSKELKNGSKVFAFLFREMTMAGMSTTTDPFALAELILLGTAYAEDDGFGDHVIMLHSYASLQLIEETLKPDPTCIRTAFWGPELSTHRPNIRLQEWLVSELKANCKTAKQRQIRHEFNAFLAKLDNRKIGLAEQFLWKILP